VIVAGDSNCKHPSWNCNRSNPNGTLLKDFADDYIRIHSTDEPTLLRKRTRPHDLHLDEIQLTEEQKHVTDTVEAFDRTDFTCDGTYLKEFRTSPSELKETIKKLPNNKAPGEDEIRNMVIKNLANKAKVQFHYIINAVIELQYFPHFPRPGRTLSSFQYLKRAKNLTRGTLDPSAS
jgi:hypothetical protein